MENRYPYFGDQINDNLNTPLKTIKTLKTIKMIKTLKMIKVKNFILEKKLVSLSLPLKKLRDFKGF